jgi:hypothetical protein
MCCLESISSGDLGPMLATSLIDAEPDGTLFSGLTPSSYNDYYTHHEVFSQWPAIAEGMITDPDSGSY